ncbi:hypothetical protein ACFOD4_08420 [Pseudoroseomonas globiformis]|uniref:Translation initiation factor IF-2 n=1 Tax=Teichococcus globiformis TaxID=2307229 RepID=A0ABV7G4B1_9PROT
MSFTGRAVFLAALLLANPVLAQSWPNETGLGGDLMSNSGRQFDRMRALAPAQSTGGFAMAAVPVPLLDWTPPPSLAAPAPTSRPAQPRRAVRRAASRPAAPAAASVTAMPRQDEWERSLAERERELDAVRRKLEEDRRRFEASRRPDASAPVRATPAVAPISPAAGAAR